MTTPPTAYTAELETMIAVMSGDFQSARRWLRQVPKADRPRFLGNVRDLLNITEQLINDEGC